MSVTVKGDQELAELFKVTLPNEARKVVRKAAREGAKIVADAAKIKVPKDTGTLRRSIRVRATKRTRRGTIGSRVITGEGFFRGETFYGGFVEFGTSKMRPRPFLRPAVDENRQRVVRVFVNRLKESINRIKLRKVRGG